MSVDINLTAVRMVNVFELNISHYYRPIAANAGIDQYIWRPFELGITRLNNSSSPCKSASHFWKLSRRNSRHSMEKLQSICWSATNLPRSM
jgi:hypothetical protein